MVITGSHNWSSSAENVNDENTVIVHDPRVANLYHQEFRGILIALGVIQSVEDQEGGAICTVYPNPHETCFLCVGNPMQPLVLWCYAICQDAKCSPQSSVPTTTQLSLAGVASGIYTASVDGQGLPTRIVVE